MLELSPREVVTWNGTWGRAADTTLVLVGFLSMNGIPCQTLASLCKVAHLNPLCPLKILNTYLWFI